MSPLRFSLSAVDIATVATVATAVAAVVVSATVARGGLAPKMAQTVCQIRASRSDRLPDLLAPAFILPGHLPACSIETGQWMAPQNNLADPNVCQPTRNCPVHQSSPGSCSSSRSSSVSSCSICTSSISSNGSTGSRKSSSNSSSSSVSSFVFHHFLVFLKQRRV